MSAQFVQTVKNELIRELEELHQEIRTLLEPLSDEQLWIKPVEPGNTIGHLILHLTGNLNHFIGGQLAKNGYIRDREREFAESNLLPRGELLGDFDAAVALFRQVVGGLTEEQLEATFPTDKFGVTYKALLHFVAHFALHRGQMSYLARLVGPKM